MEQTKKKAPCCTFLHAHDEAVNAVRQVMPPEDTLLELADFFHVFGDSTRIRILYALCAHELCVCDIAALLGMTISAISHQLRILRGAKMVRCRRSGKTVFYSLADEHVYTILNQSFTHVTEPA